MSYNLKRYENNKKEFLDIEDIAFTLMKEGKGNIKSDVDGSYTGISFDGEIPTQDADDL